MGEVITLKGAVDGAQLYVIPQVALVTPFQESARNTKGAPTGPPQTIIGEAVVQFFGSGLALRVQGSPLDVANSIAGKRELL